jgi:hypothetical protein
MLSLPALRLYHRAGNIVNHKLKEQGKYYLDENKITCTACHKRLKRDIRPSQAKVPVERHKRGSTFALNVVEESVPRHLPNAFVSAPMCVDDTDGDSAKPLVEEALFDVSVGDVDTVDITAANIAAQSEEAPPLDDIASQWTASGDSTRRSGSRLSHLMSGLLDNLNRGMASLEVAETKSFAVILSPRSSTTDGHRERAAELRRQLDVAAVKTLDAIGAINDI